MFSFKDSLKAALLSTVLCLCSTSLAEEKNTSGLSLTQISSNLPHCTNPLKENIKCFGEYSHVDGSKYIGEFENGVFNGFGTYTFSRNGKNAGDKYSGWFTNGEFDGEGVYIFGGGSKYTGEFTNGKFSGQGEYILNNGSRYKGGFKNGLLEGKGEHIFNNGDKYIGNYKKGERDGKGVYVYANGKKQDGIWESGKFLLSIETSLSEAEYKAGVNYYHEGNGFEKNHKKAIKWLKKSAENNLSSAQAQLGRVYILGDDEIKDFKKAIYWLKKSAEQGDKLGQYLLGQEYYLGNIYLKQNHSLAFYWIKKSALQGLKDAQHSIGKMHLLGEGVEQDSNKAYEWLMKSAEQGDSDSQLLIGYMYWKGTTTSKDLDAAIGWFAKSAEQGNEKAKAFLKEMMQLRRDASSKLDLSNAELAKYGSGFVVSRDGVVATNYHVVENCKHIIIDGLKATIFDIDSKNDLAILKVSKEYKNVASIAHSSPDLGDDVFVFGYPLTELLNDSHISLTKGSISGLAGVNGNPSHFRFSAATQPGNSGGPIVLKNGLVAGIVKSILGKKASNNLNFLPQNVNFGIYSSILIDMLKLNSVSVSNQPIKDSVLEHYVEATRYIACYQEGD